MGRQDLHRVPDLSSLFRALVPTSDTSRNPVGLQLFIFVFLDNICKFIDLSDWFALPPELLHLFLNHIFLNHELNPCIFLLLKGFTRLGSLLLMLQTPVLFFIDAFNVLLLPGRTDLLLFWLSFVQSIFFLRSSDISLLVPLADCIVCSHSL